MRPDAIPVRPLSSRAVLPPDAVAALFGAGAALRDSARVALVQAGREIGRVAVALGDSLALVLDRTHEIDGVVRLQGPLKATGLVTPTPIPSRLVLPDGLRRAWGVGDRATLQLGPVALAVAVASGAELAAEVERAAWLAAGRCDTARWLPGVDMVEAPEAEAPDDGALVIERRVVTETDVRQARLRRQRIRLSAGQIVTPAARSLADEWNVFEDET